MNHVTDGYPCLKKAAFPTSHDHFYLIQLRKYNAIWLATFPESSTHLKDVHSELHTQQTSGGTDQCFRKTASLDSAKSVLWSPKRVLFAA